MWGNELLTQKIELDFNVNEIMSEKSEHQIKLECAIKNDNLGSCCICFCDDPEYVNLTCGHIVFCAPCFKEYRKYKSTCPLCVKQISSVVKLNDFIKQKKYYKQKIFFDNKE